MIIRLHEPTFGEAEIAAVVDVLRSKRVTSGEKVRDLEAEFGRHAVMCNSGSSANLLAVAALVTEGRLKPGDEVIVPALCWSTTIWPLVQYGLVPKIVDIDPETLNIDLDQMEAAVGPKTAGIMIVHVYGNPCDMSRIGSFCFAKNLVLIEDCCEALGATWRGAHAGTFGDVGTLSFYFSHHITTIEGGMCLTADQPLAERMRILRAHGWTRDLADDSYYRESYPHIDPRFLFVGAGYNLRATEMAAAMGLVQLPKLAGFVQQRRLAAGMLANHLAGLEWLSPQKETEGGMSSWFGFPLVVGQGAPFNAGDLRAYLERHGIETRPIICGNIARQPGIKQFTHRLPGRLDNANHIMRNGFALPCHQDIGPKECDRMANVIADFLRTA